MFTPCFCGLTFKFIILGLLTFNYISRANSQVTAIREIAENSCNNARSIVLQKIEILRRHPDSAVLGEGYFVSVTFENDYATNKIFASFTKVTINEQFCLLDLMGPGYAAVVMGSSVVII